MGTAHSSPRVVMYYAYPVDIEEDTIKLKRTGSNTYQFNEKWTPVHESIKLAFKKFEGIKTYGEDITLTLKEIKTEDRILVIHFEEQGFVEWDDVEVFSQCIQIGICKTLAVEHLHGVKNPKIVGFRFKGGRYGHWPREGYYTVQPSLRIEE